MSLGSWCLCGRSWVFRSWPEPEIITPVCFHGVSRPVATHQVKNKTFFGSVSAFAAVLADWAVIKAAAVAVIEESFGAAPRPH